MRDGQAERKYVQPRASDSDPQADGLGYDCAWDYAFSQPGCDSRHSRWLGLTVIIKR